MTNNLQTLTANRGEWSEIYAFFKILSDRGITSADGDLNVIPGKTVPVLKVIRNESDNGVKTYDTTNEDVVSVIGWDEQIIGSIPYSEIKEGVRRIFKEIYNSDKRTFTSDSATDLMSKLSCSKIKSASLNKADIKLVIHDSVISTSKELGFSIKSMLGSPATLLNASGATNLTYEIVSSERIHAEEVNSIGGESKIRDRAKKIYGDSGDLVFVSVDKEVFRDNLKKIDSLFPQVVAELLKAYYSDKGPEISKLIEYISEKSSFVIQNQINKEDLTLMVKRFLVAVALGMLPSKKWDGTTDNGGYIIVKEDGEVVCYHLYNRDEFASYLYKNTKLDTPSSSRHKFGVVYNKEGKDYMKLNLQIRFIR